MLVAGEAVEITLSAEANRRSIPRCPASDKKVKKVGQRLSILVPSKLRTKQGSDIDYQCDVVLFGADSLGVCHGPHWSYGLPAFRNVPVVQPRELVVDWIDEPSCAAPITPPLEFQATSADGTRWHWIGMLGLTFEYSTRNQKAADMFDSLLATLCTD